MLSAVELWAQMTAEAGGAIARRMREAGPTHQNTRDNLPPARNEGMRDRGRESKI